MVECGLVFVLQVITIIAAVFGICVGIYCFFLSSFAGAMNGVFTIFFALALLMTELYRFSFFRYFSFLCTNWGKSIMCLFMFLRTFWDPRANVFLFIASLCYLILAIVFLVMFFCGHKTASVPLFQQGGGVELGTDANEFFGTVDNATAPQEN